MTANSDRYLGRMLRPLLLGTALLACAIQPAPAQQTRTEQPAASRQGVWQFEPEAGAPQSVVASRSMPRRYLAVRLNQGGLDNTLGRLDRAARLGERQMFEVPLPDGTLTRLEVWEESILGPEMAAMYPEIKTYVGRGIDDPTITARLDKTSLGFHGQLIGEEGTVLIDPLDKDAGLYMTFWKHEVPKPPFECGVTRDFRDDPVHAVRHLAEALPQGSEININPVGGAGVRRYRLRIVTTANYTSFFSGVSGGAAGQVATTVNRMDGIYAREVSIRFELLSTDALTGAAVGSCDYPFAASPSVNGAFLTQNHDFLVCRYGAGGWDIGHVFGAGGGGGLAELGAVCRDASKGRGATQLNNPSGDVFDVDYVSHEVGHQINADHTFNGTSGSCTGNRRADSAYEPGSGTTIMAYAGICSGQNVQSNSNDYFHTRSIDQMTDYAFTGGGQCGTLLPSITDPPIVSAGLGFTVPQKTPFKLTATASDPNSNPVTVNWEQYDLGPAAGVPSPSAATGPLFRSRPPSSNFQRILPVFADILNPPSTRWEALPETDRPLTFRAIARDGLGGVRRDSTVVNVSGSPFEIVSPASGDILECAIPESVLWNVGGGSIATNVAIKLSNNPSPAIDQFTTLVPSTPNDGSAPINVPMNLHNVDRRLMLEPEGHSFFAVSQSFQIRDTLPPVVTPPGPITKECTSPLGTPVELGLATAADACVGPLSATSNAPALFPLGTTPVTWSSSDGNGNTGNAIQQVTIKDTTPPILEVSVTPTQIWPPNHQMVRIRANIIAADVCDAAPTVELVSITANEPDNSNGDGFTVDDVQGAEFGIDDREFFLRAERRGLGTGRIYTITYKATDASGNTTTKQVFVTVPQSQGNN